jgi:hypothetical protein
MIKRRQLASDGSQTSFFHNPSQFIQEAEEHARESRIRHETEAKCKSIFSDTIKEYKDNLRDSIPYIVDLIEEYVKCRIYLSTHESFKEDDIMSSFFNLFSKESLIEKSKDRMIRKLERLLGVYFPVDIKKER